MTTDASRRTFLALAAALGICPAALAQTTPPAPRPSALGGSGFGPARPFGFDALIAEARDSARQPFAPRPTPDPDVLERIDYSAHWRIRFRADRALPLQGGDAPVEFFHLGRYAREPVRVHAVRDGEARELLYSPDLFEMPDDSPARELGEGAGFAGLRVMRPDSGPDWLSFLGAAYFRSDGPERQYGLSARGLAIDTGLDRPEEFPAFTAFWIGEGEREGEAVTIWTRLESPSVAGAYRIGAGHRPEGGQFSHVEARLFFRKPVERLGVAPLTSMFWFSERDRTGARDWRPEIHDSDGLALHTGAGERLWRPLSNPRRVIVSSFFDENPRGFGLIQRDRDFANYEDDGVWYDRRPSVWVTPLGGWGRGAVQLVEIPTTDETSDNIVAYWTPESLPAPGEPVAFDWRLDWAATDPTPPLGRVVATRLGEGGVPGAPGPEGSVKYVVDFSGGPLAGLDAEAGVAPMVEASVGRLTQVSAHRVIGTEIWRLIFDIEGADGRPVDLRAYLALDGAPLTETWIALSDDDGAPRG